MIDFRICVRSICSEVSSVLEAVREDEVESFVREILKAEKVFVMGAGRVGLILSTFAKRLNHIRVNAFVVGESTNPDASSKDLLIAGSGSGETATTITIATLAKKRSARVALITVHPDSTLGKLADLVLLLPAPTKLRRPGEIPSEQPMSNLFEQSLLILCDALTIMIQKEKGIREEEMWQRHANLE